MVSLTLFDIVLDNLRMNLQAEERCSGCNVYEESVNFKEHSFQNSSHLLSYVTNMYHFVTSTPHAGGCCDGCCRTQDSIGGVTILMSLATGD
jgi:hypothetical protein